MLREEGGVPGGWRQAGGPGAVSASSSSPAVPRKKCPRLERSPVKEGREIQTSREGLSFYLLPPPQCQTPVVFRGVWTASMSLACHPWDRGPAGLGVCLSCKGSVCPTPLAPAVGSSSAGHPRGLSVPGCCWHVLALGRSPASR